jgi:hypothetical protein
METSAIGMKKEETLVKDQIKLTPRQLAEVKIIATRTGKSLQETYQKFVKDFLEQRRVERANGVRPDRRYGHYLAGAKTSNMMLPKSLVSQVADLKEKDSVGARSAILYTAATEGIEEFIEANGDVLTKDEVARYEELARDNEREREQREAKKKR